MKTTFKLVTIAALFAAGSAMAHGTPTPPSFTFIQLGAATTGGTSVGNSFGGTTNTSGHHPVYFTSAASGAGEISGSGATAGVSSGNSGVSAYQLGGSGTIGGGFAVAGKGSNADFGGTGYATTTEGSSIYKQTYTPASNGHYGH